MVTIALSASPADPAGGNLTGPCVAEARRLLEAAGHLVREFAATGAGGRQLEAAIAAGECGGVLDLTLSELADELLGGFYPAGSDRLTAASLHGVPQVVVPGGLDAVRHGPLAGLPETLRARRLHPVDGNHTLVRTTPPENDRLGREVALRISAARGPAALLVPLRGFSALDADGQPFWWPEANATILQSVRNWISPHVRPGEVDCHVNDPGFARAAVTTLLEMVEKGS